MGSSSGPQNLVVTTDSLTTFQSPSPSVSSPVEENTSPSSLEMKLKARAYYQMYPSEWLNPTKGSQVDRFLKRYAFTKPIIFVLLGIIMGSLVRSIFFQIQYERESLRFFLAPSGQSPSSRVNTTVGVFYYPWYAEDFHYGKGFVREQLLPPQEPALGKYNDSDPAVIAQHLAWAKQANIRLWVMSWWGPDSPTDETIRSTILPHKDLGDHQLTLFYETNGRMEHGGRKGPSYSTEKIVSDMKYMCKHYFSHPNYYRVDGMPVLVVYLTRDLSRVGLLDHVIGLFRETARQEGYPNLYIIGDQVFGEPPKSPTSSSTEGIGWKNLVHAMEVLDGVTNYDVYGSMGRPSPYVTTRELQDHFRQAKEWRDLAHQFGCAFVPSVAPGYNDLGVRYLVEHAPLSRHLDGPNSAKGSLFRTSLQYATKLVEPTRSPPGNGGKGELHARSPAMRLQAAPSLLLVNSFNEWHEDSQIEPAAAVGGSKRTSTTAFSSTSLPYRLTRGLDYEAYGTLYLDILHEETFVGPEVEDNLSRTRHSSGLSQFGQNSPRLRSSSKQQQSIQ